MTDTVHTSEITIRFSHSDPAGIVYYPHYFDLFHTVYEDWFGASLGVPYADLVMGKRVGFPAVHAECDFAAPCRMGEKLLITLLVEAIGTKSMTITFIGHIAGKQRLKGRVVIVYLDLETAKSMPFPDDLRARFARYMEACRDWRLAA